MLFLEIDIFPLIKWDVQGDGLFWACLIAMGIGVRYQLVVIEFDAWFNDR